MRKNLIFYKFGLILSIQASLVFASFPEYSSNPYTFHIDAPVYVDNFFVEDLNKDGLKDFIYRTTTHLYAYDHSGTNQLWPAIAIGYPGVDINNHGVKFSAADVDGDNTIEIVALTDTDSLVVISGMTGAIERKWEVPNLLADQMASHVQIVNLDDGIKNHFAIVQTSDISIEYHDAVHIGYYVNRSLIAINLLTGNVLWRVEQNNNLTDGYYEGYWGQAHGPFFAADVDADGYDEVIGGNMIQEDGTVVNLNYPTSWVGIDNGNSYIDHLDAISVGDFRPDWPGIEWVLSTEDNTGAQSYQRASLMRSSGLVWSSENTIFADWQRAYKEPQHTAVGNFDNSRSSCEIWVRSRLNGGDDEPSQWPWMFDISGNLIYNYKMSEKLPKGFHPESNSLGIEFVWTIDWKGGPVESITGRARWSDLYTKGPIGIFNAVTGDSVWTSMKRAPNLNCGMIYVADIAGDAREEIIAYDTVDQTIKVFWNSETNPYPVKPDKWDDPLYTKVKQNWNNYSPGSYTYTGYPTTSNVQVTDITPVGATVQWDTDQPSTSQVLYGVTPELGQNSPVNSTLVTHHSVTISGLLINTDYYFRTKSINDYSKIGFSQDGVIELIELTAAQMTSLEKNGTHTLRLNWTASPGITEYNVYRDTDPFFEADTVNGTNLYASKVSDEDANTAGIQWTDAAATCGDATQQTFYRIVPVIYHYEGPQSNALGEYDFNLVTTSATKFNAIALPMLPSGVTSAYSLSQYIPRCNSVARWNVAHQAFEQYIPGTTYNNFAVNAGDVYYVNIRKDTCLTFIGNVSSPVYSLVHNSVTSSFNDIMLPFEKSDIHRASELAADIPNCDGVIRWDALTQSYKQYVPGNQSTNFDVATGMGYGVSVTASVIWPSGSSKTILRESSEVVATTSSSAPHAVWGYWTDPKKELPFKAYLSRAGQDTVTQNAPGCISGASCWLVQCAAFDHPWSVGDTLVVDFYSDGKRILQTRQALSDKAHDQVDMNMFVSGPTHHALNPNYPNPFNSKTVIPYEVSGNHRVTISIYNTLGQLVRTLKDGDHEAGRYTAVWDGRGRFNETLPSGIYIVRLSMPGYQQSMRIIYLK